MTADLKPPRQATVGAVLDRLPALQPFGVDEFGATETVALGRMQSLTAGFLHRNWVAIPHVTHNDEVDVTALEDRRRAWNEAHPDARLSPLVPVMKAVAGALAALPKFNASLSPDGGSVILKKYFHIGFAVDTPGGLLVAVVRDCDRKPAAEINAEVRALAAQAREKGLTLAQMSGGCMTVSSLGHIGGTSFSPIINAPEVAILGVTRLQARPVPAEGGGVAWRQMLPLSLSYDHRLLNGADAARFVVEVGRQLDAFDPGA